jgi:nicotinamide-nucleotide amidase
MKSIIRKLINKKISISVAESCTGGLLSSTITSISGSSTIFNMGLITYSNISKTKILKVNKVTIKNFGAVSSQCCKDMVKKLSNISKSKINISITGIAGPNGGSVNKPVGLVFIGLKFGKKLIIKEKRFKSNIRKEIQRLTVEEVFKMISNLIN